MGWLRIDHFGHVYQERNRRYKRQMGAYGHGNLIGKWLEISSENGNTEIRCIGCKMLAKQIRSLWVLWWSELGLVSRPLVMPVLGDTLGDGLDLLNVRSSYVSSLDARWYWNGLVLVQTRSLSYSRTSVSSLFCETALIYSYHTGWPIWFPALCSSLHESICDALGNPHHSKTSTKTSPKSINRTAVPLFFATCTRSHLVTSGRSLYPRTFLVSLLYQSQRASTTQSQS